MLVGGFLAVPSLTFHINLAQTFWSSQPYHIEEGTILIIWEAIKGVAWKSFSLQVHFKDKVAPNISVCWKYFCLLKNAVLCRQDRCDHYDHCYFDHCDVLIIRIITNASE